MSSKRILVCGGTGCISAKSRSTYEILEEELRTDPRLADFELTFTGCHGFCEQAPVIILEPEGTFYAQVTPEKAKEFTLGLKEGRTNQGLLYTDPVSGQKIARRDDIPFYQKQKRLTLKYCGLIDPEKIEDYVAIGGYAAVKKALQMDGLEIVNMIKESGLRGRGGGGFPTGTKWEFARNAEGDKKYIICNADEGDPGAFMDMSISEGVPHAVLEGMIIGGLAIGASEGYIYVRAEYPLAVKRLAIAIEQAEKEGYLGEHIFGSDFSFRIRLKQGAGAFVCGEETALINSIQGNRGMPRPRPPFPAVKGLWDRPTVINNVETLANVPVIFNMGSKEYAKIGTEQSKGTKIFALTGKINNTGLVEVPMGITLREIIYDIAGGIKEGKEFKAVQIGGPSGGCLPKEHLDLPIDYDSLIGVGAMMGSGGLVVADESTCMVDLARFFLTFTRTESCGKCTPCREGTKRLLEILERITTGQGREGDIELLEGLGRNVIDSSLCGLGQTAPNPVLSTIRYFREEYEMHINEKFCPAGVCKKLKRRRPKQ